MRINICGISVDDYSFDEVINEILTHVFSGGEPQYVVTPNAHHIVTLQKDSDFHQIYRNAFLAVPDGVSLLWAAQFLGTPLRGRVNGTDLFERLSAAAAKQKLKVFLLGGRPGAADQASAVLQAKYIGLNIVGTYCPSYSFETDEAELAQIRTLIKAAAPDILFVGLGAPKQEKWISQNYQELGIPISLGIGVSFELVAGMVERAPIFMQKVGLEWLFRLIVEPRRLWRRYLIGNLLFVHLIFRQRFGFISSPGTSL